jgi:RHS repeat-associated protein
VTCGSAACGTLGAVLATQYYHPFGGTRHVSGTLPTSFGFTGQRHDGPSVDLMFYNARHLDTRTGRFISADTIVPGAGNPQALNRYSYVLNAPTRYTDPTGHYCYDNNSGDLFGTCTNDDASTYSLSPRFPRLPRGYRWASITVSFSAYPIIPASEGMFIGPQVPVPGHDYLSVPDDFLYSRYGVGMQGTGAVEKGDITYYVSYASGHWEHSGNRVYLYNGQWLNYMDNSVFRGDIEGIKLVNASFTVSRTPPDLIPYFSLAGHRDGPPRGSYVFVPSLINDTPYMGLFRIDDRCHACATDPLTVDLYVGVASYETYYRWFTRDNLPAYVAVPPR